MFFFRKASWYCRGVQGHGGDQWPRDHADGWHRGQSHDQTWRSVTKRKYSLKALKFLATKIRQMRFFSGQSCKEDLEKPTPNFESTLCYANCFLPQKLLQKHVSRIKRSFPSMIDPLQSHPKIFEESSLQLCLRPKRYAGQDGPCSCSWIWQQQNIPSQCLWHWPHSAVCPDDCQNWQGHWGFDCKLARRGEYSWAAGRVREGVRFLGKTI